MQNRKRLIPVVLVLALVVVGYVLYANDLLPFTPTERNNVVSGFIEGDDVTIASELGGRIASIAVDEGDPVKAGQPVVQLDRSTLDAQIAQAEAAVATAQAQLTQLKNGASGSDAAAARAALDAAKQNYAEVSAGPTVDQLGQLKAQMDAAKAAVDKAQAEYDRAGGASNPFIVMSPQALALEQATSNLYAATAAFDDARSHPTDSELAAAQSQVQQAQAALDRLTPTADSIAVAQDQVKQAQAALAVLVTQSGKMTLTSPVNGVVSRRSLHAGEIASPNALVLSVTNLDTVKLTIYVPETQIGSIKLGDKIPVQVDSFPDRTFQGTVIFINTQAEFTPRNVQTKAERVNTVFAVKLQIPNPDHALKPGMPADAPLAVE